MDTARDVLGFTLEFPVIVAPSTRQRDLHPDGDIGMYLGATATKTPIIVASGSSIPIEKIAAAANGPRWSQFYPIQDLTASREQIERFQANGARGIVVTVDQQTSVYDAICTIATWRRTAAAPATSGRRSDREGPALYRVSAGRCGTDWGYLDEIKRIVKGPMLVKGILTAEDARICVQRGYDGIVVSNHGGRSMDYGPSTLEVLPEIVDAVGGKIPVFVDSGFRRGSDVVKAIALGARPSSWVERRGGVSVLTARQACSACSKSFARSSGRPWRAPAARRSPRSTAASVKVDFP